MKKILFFLLLSLVFYFVDAQGPSKTCPTCGQSIAKCKYKGKHLKKKPAKPVTLANGFENGHEWVDLGLPSGTKWATMNVGANSPSDYGSYFAWGETSPKREYNWSNWKYDDSDVSGHKFSKYVIDSKYGKVDGKIELEFNDDVAFVDWGSGWRIPSNAQQNELLSKCKWKWTSVDGNNGYKIIGPNGNSIFLPAAGHRYGEMLIKAGVEGCYWSRSHSSDNQWLVFNFFFYQERSRISEFNPITGLSIRPVLAL